MNEADIPLRLPVAFAQNAGVTYINYPLPIPSQIGIINGAASFNDGFPPLTMTPLSAGGIPPDGRDMNSVLNMISAWIRWYDAGGPIGFDSSFSGTVGGYPAGAILSSNSTLGAFWFNQIDANGTNPDGGGSNWLGFTPLDLMAVDTGTVNAVIANLPINPPSWAYMNGKPFLIRKLGANTAGVTVTLNTLTPAKSLIHSDGSPIAPLELPDAGWFTALYDLIGDAVQLQSQAGAITATTLPLQNAAMKAWGRFRWSGSAVIITNSWNVGSIVRAALGQYNITLNSGFNFANGGYVTGSAGNIGGGSRGLIFMGSGFAGINPTFSVYINDAGGTGGTDPVSDVGFQVFGN